MYQVTLTEEQRAQLNKRAHAPGITPRTRDRLEMVRLSDAGWHVPAIARHLGQHAQTVRAWIKAYVQHGFEGLADQPRGGSTSALTPAILAAVRQEVQASQRTWSGDQLATWIQQQHGVRRGAAQVRRQLRAAGLSYQRTSRSLRHKQDPQEVQAKRQELMALEKRGTAEPWTCATWMRPALP